MKLEQTYAITEREVALYPTGTSGVVIANWLETQEAIDVLTSSPR